MLPAQQETQHKRQITNTMISFVGRFIFLVPNGSSEFLTDHRLDGQRQQSKEGRKTYECQKSHGSLGRRRPVQGVLFLDAVSTLLSTNRILFHDLRALSDDAGEVALVNLELKSVCLQ